MPGRSRRPGFVIVSGEIEHCTKQNHLDMFAKHGQMAAGGNVWNLVEVTVGNIRHHLKNWTKESSLWNLVEAIVGHLCQHLKNYKRAACGSLWKIRFISFPTNSNSI